MSDNQSTGFALNQTGLDVNSGFNDIYIDASGNLVTVSGVNDLIQTVKNSLWLYIGEYQFDTTIGIAYKGIFNGDGLFQNQIEQSILQCNTYLTTAQYQAYGIKNISKIEFRLDRETRILSISVNLALNNGTNINLEVGS